MKTAERIMPYKIEQVLANLRNCAEELKAIP